MREAAHADLEDERRIKLVATNPAVECKGATVPYTLLPADVREAFLKKYNAKLCQAYGIVQPE